MEGLSVETYQAIKRNNNSDTNYNDLETRISNIESQQMNIYNEFKCDFSEHKYIDKNITTAIITNEGIVPRQYLNNIFIDFSKNDDYIDYDKTVNVGWENNSYMKFNRDSVTNGTMVTFPIELNNAIGFKLDSNYILPYAIGNTSEVQVANMLWTVEGVDKNGRLWIFSKNSTTNTATEKIKLVIYNKDMTIYKTQDFENFFYTLINSGGLRFDMPNSSLIFNDENICFLASSIDCNNSYYVICSLLCIDIINNTVTKILNDNSQFTYHQHTNLNMIYYKPTIYINNDILVYVTCYPYLNDCNIDWGNKITFYENVVFSFKDPKEYKCICKYTLFGYNGNNSPNITTGHSPSNIYKYKNCLYHLRNADAIYNSVFNISNYFLCENSISDKNDSVIYKEKTITCSSNDTWASYIAGLFGLVFSQDKLYNFYNPIGSKILYCRRYSFDINDKLVLTKEKEIQYNLEASATIKGKTQLPVFIIKDDKIHIFYITIKSDDNNNMCVKYLIFDLNFNIALKETILFETKNKICFFDAKEFNNEIVAFVNYVDGSNNICKMIKIDRVSSSLQYYYYDNVQRVWNNINSGEQAIFGSPVSEITIKAILESNTYNCSPEIKNINIQSWNNDGQEYRQSEYYSTQIESVQNDGKGVLTSNYELNDGVIDWYISFDGGKTYNPTKLDEEFVYTHLSAPDFRVKAVLSVTDNAKKLPIVHDYTLKTSHIVLHSDLEEIQINLIKTNFKIDTYTNASKNGLLKMTIDTLSDNTFIDEDNSDYVYYHSYGYAGGNYIQTKQEEIDGKYITILLTTDELLKNVDDKILYYVSVDGGITFEQIVPNIKKQLNNTNSKTSKIVMKAQFWGEAKLSAWGWAWD